MNNSPFISVPPIDAPLVKKDNTIGDEWKNHMDAITQNLGFIVSHDRFDSTKEETPVITVISLTTAQRNDLQNARNGTVIYNTTTNRFNFRENGAWVTFTPVAA
jgi:hypothetical protein